MACVTTESPDFEVDRTHRGCSSSPPSDSGPSGPTSSGWYPWPEYGQRRRIACSSSGQEVGPSEGKLGEDPLYVGGGTRFGNEGGEGGLGMRREEVVGEVQRDSPVRPDFDGNNVSPEWRRRPSVWREEGSPYEK